MIVKLIQHCSNQYEQMVHLRHEVLRKPLKLSFPPHELAQEKHDILIGGFDENELIGCCILTKLDDGYIKLRQMAISEAFQGKGYGSQILLFAENYAKEHGYTTLFMHARTTALRFYKENGYVIVGEPFTEVKIPHVKLEKVL